MHWITDESAAAPINQPFTKTDVITLQDPHNFENREIEDFQYIRSGEDTKVAKVATMSVNTETRRILEKAGLMTEGGKGSVVQSDASAIAQAEKDRKAREAAEAMLAGDGAQRKKGVSSNMMSASFTSTAVPVFTKVEEQRMTGEFSFTNVGPALGPCPSRLTICPNACT